MFVDWCNQEGIDDTTELGGRDFYEYRIWRQNDGDLKTVTLRTQLSTLRKFVRFLETIEAASQDVHETIVLPTLDDGEGVRDATVDPQRASEILAYLDRYEYASLDHALFEVLWETGCRIGEAHGLDVSDVDTAENYISFEHDPQNTPLKNKRSGERLVAINDRATNVLSDYIDMTRTDVTDAYEREPLFSTEHGRMVKSWLRKRVYRLTQPCLFTDCPHGRQEQECEAKGPRRGSQCPSSVRPHDVRRGAVTKFLNEDMPTQMVADRVDTNTDVLEKHYNQQTKEDKMTLRRKYIDNGN